MKSIISFVFQLKHFSEDLREFWKMRNGLINLTVQCRHTHVYLKCTIVYMYLN
jgi:hypothetical protein